MIERTISSMIMKTMTTKTTTRGLANSSINSSRMVTRLAVIMMVIMIPMMSITDVAGQTASSGEYTFDHMIVNS